MKAHWIPVCDELPTGAALLATAAMNVPGGCLVRVDLVAGHTPADGDDVEHPALSLVFVPGVSFVPDETGTFDHPSGTWVSSNDPDLRWAPTS